MAAGPTKLKQHLTLNFPIAWPTLPTSEKSDAVDRSRPRFGHSIFRIAAIRTLKAQYEGVPPKQFAAVLDAPCRCVPRRLAAVSNNTIYFLG
ncbi:hypothetical protein BN2476_870004 [Paraburkholderia piptadeniae]|uniref:Uncharacterized protein n=1 Tax=Paraburkholderia piptadeniae TaxID=1701573 RepID=A0A1N7STF9_9BURK|nr:hypothetical protein BN2476_870004 [Paraburkholderia piptadeniae]